MEDESNIIIGKNNKISKSVIIHKNVSIGDNNFIGDNVIIYPNTIIGNNNNIFNGNIIGEFRGKLRNNVITFDWQETPKQQSLQQPKQQGRGVLVFSENCKEFYGSYGTGNSTNNFGNWQGSNIPKNMSK